MFIFRDSDFCICLYSEILIFVRNVNNLVYLCILKYASSPCVLGDRGQNGPLPKRPKTETAQNRNGPIPKRPTFFSCLSLDVNCMQCFYYVCKFSLVCSNISHRCLENE